MESAPTLTLFWQSLLIGLSIAAPVGQIGVLAIQRTIDHGRAAGLATGLGAALADAVYGAVGAFGVTTLVAWLLGLRLWLALFGALGAAVVVALFVPELTLRHTTGPGAGAESAEGAERSRPIIPAME